jgi:predicted ATP-grasp superfamily ATP-dependent carboligase
MQHKNILLTGGRGPAVLELARQMSRSGHTIYVAESTKIQYCQFSNAVKKNFIVPDPMRDEMGYINTLCNILDKYKIDMLIPAYDDVYFISKHKDKLAKHATIFCDNLVKIKNLNNKYTFAQLVEELNCNTPKTLLINNENEWQEFQKKPTLSAPYMVKSFYASGGSEVITIKTQEDVAKIRFKPPFIVQEFLQGKVLSSTGIAHNGEMVLNVVYEPLFVYRENGPAICLQAVKHPKVLALVKHVVKAQKYTGLIGFDIIENEDGTLYLLECNPRVTSGVHLIPQEADIADKFFNEQAEYFEVMPDKPLQISFAGMLKVLFDLRGEQFKQWLYCATHSRDAIFDSKDIMPSFSIPVLALFYLHQYLKYKKLPDDNIFYHMDW